jgi:hypothetical protein
VLCVVVACVFGLIKSGHLWAGLVLVGFVIFTTFGQLWITELIADRLVSELVPVDPKQVLPVRHQPHVTAALSGLLHRLSMRSHLLLGSA